MKSLKLVVSPSFSELSKLSPGTLAGCETLQTCKMAVHGATAIFRAFKLSPCNLAARCRASGVAAPTGSREILVLGEGRVAASPSGMFSIVTAGPGAGNLIFQTLQKVAPQPYLTFFQHPPMTINNNNQTPTANPAPFGRATRRPTHCDRRYGIPDPLDPEISGLPRPDMGWGLLPFFKGPRDPKRRSEPQKQDR